MSHHYTQIKVKTELKGQTVAPTLTQTDTCEGVFFITKGG